MTVGQQARDGRAGIVVAILHVALPDGARLLCAIVSVQEHRVRLARVAVVVCDERHVVALAPLHVRESLLGLV